MLNFVSGTILSRVQKLAYFATALCVGAVIWLVAIERASDSNLADVRALNGQLQALQDADTQQESLRAAVYRAQSASSLSLSFEPAAKAFEVAHQDLEQTVRRFGDTASVYGWSDRYELREVGTLLSAAAATVDQLRRDPNASAALVSAFEGEYAKSREAIADTRKGLMTRSRALESAADAITAQRRFMASVLFAVGALIMGMAIVLVVRSFIAPYMRHSAVLKDLAAERTEVTIDGLDRTDEIGEMARSLAVFRDAVIAIRHHQAETEEAKAVVEAERQKKDDLDKYYADAHAIFMASFTSALEHLSAGDLNYRLDTPYISEYESIRAAFNQAAERIQNAMISIIASADEIRAGTDRILTAADELARHTEEQASSLEETSASMEEMAATVRQNANNAQEASATAFSTRELAAAGGSIATQAIGAMSKIEESSRQVTEIVDLIEEIAFQTNILALNAAVEAARAGDAGKGFAVVANEVRTLSQRSSQALKDIKALITSSNANVNDGAALVKGVGESLTEIVTSVTKVSELISEIASASQEQASGVDQVTRAVANMDEMTQQNAALVQETNAALHTAQQQILELDQAVSMFDTGREPTLARSGTRGPAGTDNPVREQQRIIEKRMKPAGRSRRKVSASGRAHSAALAVSHDDDWQEF